MYKEIEAWKKRQRLEKGRQFGAAEAQDPERGGDLGKMGRGHIAKSSICQSEEFGLYIQAMRDFCFLVIDGKQG